MSKLPSFDVIGSIAIIEDVEQERQTAEQIMKINKRIKTVYKKTSPRFGEYRTRKLKLILGENRSVTVHKENQCYYKLNVKKVYFSPREGTERLRIVEKINEYGIGDLAMVFFAGVGCYPILISKRCNIKNVVGIESNPVAVKYFRENNKLNKVKNAKPVLGDVKKQASKYYGKCGCVIMPLPETGHKFLKQAIRCLRKNGVCFFYAISEERNLFDGWIEKIKDISEKLKRKAEILDKRRVLPFGVRKWKIRVDFRVF